MTLEEIEAKLHGRYNRNVIQSRIIAMWEIIGDNYEIMTNGRQQFIVIPDEIYETIKKKVSREVLKISLKGETCRFISYYSRS